MERGPATEIGQGKENDVPYSYVEWMPTFPGDTLNAFIRHHLVYPEAAGSRGIEGRVIVRFIVRKDGRVTDPEVKRSVDPLLDEQALILVGRMPRWNPGKQNGRPVDVYMTLVIPFQLN